MELNKGGLYYINSKPQAIMRYGQLIVLLIKKKKTQKSLINDNSLVNKKHTVISPNTNTNTIKLRKKIIL